jgi:hypothetical protein
MSPDALKGPALAPLFCALIDAAAGLLAFRKK